MPEGWISDNAQPSMLRSNLTWPSQPVRFRRRHQRSGRALQSRCKLFKGCLNIHQKSVRHRLWGGVGKVCGKAGGARGADARRAAGGSTPRRASVPRRWEFRCDWCSADCRARRLRGCKESPPGVGGAALLPPGVCGVGNASSSCQPIRLFRGRPAVAAGVADAGWSRAAVHMRSSHERVCTALSMRAETRRCRSRPRAWYQLCRNGKIWRPAQSRPSRRSVLR